MLNKIIQFSLQNRLLVLVASVLLLIGGTYTAFHTEVDVFPDLNAPTVVVMTDRKSTRLNSSHNVISRMPSSA